MLALSPFALRLVKLSFHAEEDGMAGIQQLAHDANLLFYASDEAKEGREAYKAKRTARNASVASYREIGPHAIDAPAARCTSG